MARLTPRAVGPSPRPTDSLRSQLLAVACVKIRFSIITWGKSRKSVSELTRQRPYRIHSPAWSLALFRNYSWLQAQIYIYIYIETTTRLYLPDFPPTTIRVFAFFSPQIILEYRFEKKGSKTTKTTTTDDLPEFPPVKSLFFFFHPHIILEYLITKLFPERPTSQELNLILENNMPQKSSTHQGA